MDNIFAGLREFLKACTEVSECQEESQAMLGRTEEQVNELRKIPAPTTQLQRDLLTEYTYATTDLYHYLDEYHKLSYLSKLSCQSEMMAKIQSFTSDLDALFKRFNPLMGSHLVMHTNVRKATTDQLVLGIRMLLQGTISKDGQPIEVLRVVRKPKAKGLNESYQGSAVEAIKHGDVLSLLNILVESPSVRHAEETMLKLVQIAEDKDKIHAFVEAGAIPKLMSMISSKRMHPGSATLRADAAKALSYLAAHDVHGPSIANGGAVDHLVDMLDKSSGNLDMEITAACQALTSLVTHADNQVVMLQKQNLIPRLVELMNTNTPADQKQHAMNVLGELANHTQGSEAIREARGVFHLVDMLRLGTAQQCAAALGVLWNLSSHEKSREEIASIGGISAIVEKLEASSTDEQRQLAASTLAVLAQDDANDVLIGAAGGVAPLIRLLGSGTEAQKNSAVWALAELANNSENAMEMMNSGAVPLLMSSFDKDSNLERSHAGSALTWIATLAKDKSAFAQKAGLDNIVNMLRESIDQKQIAAGIIAEIAEDDQIHRELCDLGATELLIDLAKHHSPKLAAMKALRLLSVTDAANIANSGGVHVFVDVLHHLHSGNNVEGEELHETVFQTLSDVCAAWTGEASDHPLAQILTTIGDALHGDTKKAIAGLLSLVAGRLTDKSPAHPERAAKTHESEHSFSNQSVRGPELVE